MINERNVKYVKLGFSIEVDLHYKDYIARANILKTDAEDTYDVMIELKRKDIGKWDTLDEEHFSISAKNVNLMSYNLIMDQFANGYFKRFIDRYEYEVECADKGAEFLEGNNDTVNTEEMSDIAE